MTNQAAQTMPEPVTASMCPSSDYAKGWNDCLAALSQTAVVAEPGRYFAGGPQGHFFADDLQLARDLVNLYDKDDDWTITDLRNPTGAAPAASGGEDGWKRMTAEARAIQMRHLDDHQGDVYHAMQSLVVKHGYRSTEPMMQPIEPKPPSAAPASSAHPDALPDGTLSKSTAKRVGVLATASVSERAVEMLAQEVEKDMTACAEDIRAGKLHGMAAASVRAIEQALTQQRGESSRPGMSYWAIQMPGKMPKLYGAYAFAELNWYPDEGGALVRLQEVERIGEPTTSQPSADAVRELVKRILNWQPLTSLNKADRLYQILIAAGIPFESVTDELESLLSAASDHQQNAAQGGGD